MPIEHDAIPTSPEQPVVWATTVEGAPENLERALNLVRVQILSVFAGQPGWQGAMGLVSSDGRRSMVLSFWENAATLQENIGAAMRLREHAGSLGVTISGSDRLEILFDERPG